MDEMKTRKITNIQKARRLKERCMPQDMWFTRRCQRPACPETTAARPGRKTWQQRGAADDPLANHVDQVFWECESRPTNK